MTKEDAIEFVVDLIASISHTAEDAANPDWDDNGMTGSERAQLRTALHVIAGLADEKVR